MFGIKSVFGIRSFSTSSVAHAREYKSVVNRQIAKKPDFKVGDVKPDRLYIPREKSQYPEYPYGEARIFKRADKGLFGGQVIGFGNQVSEMKNKSRRTWLPNVVSKRLWSETLGKMIKIKLTTRVLRTITKEGGLDNYVTKEKQARIKELGLFGWKLKYDILKKKEKESMGPNYEVIKIGELEKKVYYSGEYLGNEIKLIVGKRKILDKFLFPIVKKSTVRELSILEFKKEWSNKSFDEIVKACESYKVDLTEAAL